MTSAPHSDDREKLIAEWQTLESAHPFGHELQNIFLMYMRRTSCPPCELMIDTVHSSQEMTPSEQRDDVSPPPQRFTRRARSSSNSKPPAGPSEPFERAVSTSAVISKPAGGETSLLAPDGPTDGQHPPPSDKMDPVFPASSSVQ
jgi:hypothetical protein